MKKPKNLSFNADDFNWCIENDFQVYLEPMPLKRYKIAVRRLGITTEGKDYIYKDGIKIVSKVQLSSLEFKNITEASKHMPNVYKHLREKYG